MCCEKDREFCQCTCEVATLDCCEKKEFWNWWTGTDKKYAAAEVLELLEAVKEFNAGAIDAYLTNHVDKAFDSWRKRLED